MTPAPVAAARNIKNAAEREKGPSPGTTVATEPTVLQVKDKVEVSLR